MFPQTALFIRPLCSAVLCCAALRRAFLTQVLNSYGLGYRLTESESDKEDYLDRVLTGAESLHKFKWDVSLSGRAFVLLLFFFCMGGVIRSGAAQCRAIGTSELVLVRIHTDRSLRLLVDSAGFFAYC